MTTEEKAKAYDEALEKAKRELKTCGSLDCDAARQIFRFFPELCEIEDERIRLISLVKNCYENGGYALPLDEYKSLTAWLEKQKEQKPAEWSATDKAFIKDCARILDKYGYMASARRLLMMCNRHLQKGNRRP